MLYWWCFAFLFMCFVIFSVFFGRWRALWAHFGGLWADLGTYGLTFEGLGLTLEAHGITWGVFELQFSSPWGHLGSYWLDFGVPWTPKPLQNTFRMLSCGPSKNTEKHHVFGGFWGLEAPELASKWHLGDLERLLDALLEVLMLCLAYTCSIWCIWLAGWAAQDPDHTTIWG